MHDGFCQSTSNSLDARFDDNAPVFCRCEERARRSVEDDEELWSQSWVCEGFGDHLSRMLHYYKPSHRRIRCCLRHKLGRMHWLFFFFRVKGAMLTLGKRPETMTLLSPKVSLSDFLLPSFYLYILAYEKAKTAFNPLLNSTPTFRQKKKVLKKKSFLL